MKQKNFPTEYPKFIRLAKTVKDYQWKSEKTRFHLSQFCHRYRLAKSFKGMKLSDNYNDRTILGYNEVTRLFLSYTAFERVHSCAYQLLNTKSHRPIAKITEQMIIINDEKKLKKIRSNKKLETFVLKTIKKEHLDIDEQDETILEKFFDGGIKDIRYLCGLLRNCFAHGNLASTPIATTIKERESIRVLSDELLEYSDDLFSRCMTRF